MQEYFLRIRLKAPHQNAQAIPEFFLLPHIVQPAY